MRSKKLFHLIKKSAIAMVLLIIVCVAYVMILNRNSKNMTARQEVLKAMYPVLMWFNKATGRNITISNKNAMPNFSFYDLPAILINGEVLDLHTLKGRKILLVNTASECGYTGQYAQLQKLYETYKDKLVIIGVPANDFKEQEKGSNNEIASFCKANFGVSFPLLQKSTVIKGRGQHEIFQWLTDKNKNGWNDQQPLWNFCKYLVNKEGVLTHFFSSAVEPTSEEVIKAITE